MRLVGLSAADLRILAGGSAVSVDGARFEWPADDARMLRYRLEALAADPSSEPYLLHVLLSGSSLVGRVGCHAGPLDGAVEIGYYVLPLHRGGGVATSMVTQFLGWLAGRGVGRVRAAVGPDNATSRAVLRRLGFEEVGEQWDDEDGRELLLERVVTPPTSE
jgi:RimJ/RimL family protein N-acetyltransferase